MYLELVGYQIQRSFSRECGGMACKELISLYSFWVLCQSKHFPSVQPIDLLRNLEKILKIVFLQPGLWESSCSSFGETACASPQNGAGRGRLRTSKACPWALQCGLLLSTWAQRPQRWHFTSSSCGEGSQEDGPTVLYWISCGPTASHSVSENCINYVFLPTCLYLL